MTTHKLHLPERSNVCPVETAHDRTLSNDAHAIHRYLLSLPEGQMRKPKQIMEIFSTSTSRVYKAYKNLRESGYMRGDRIKYPNGKYATGSYEVFRSYREAAANGVETAIDRIRIENGAYEQDKPLFQIVGTEKAKTKALIRKSEEETA